MRVSVNSCFACFVVLALNLAHAQQRQPPRTDYEFNLSAKGPHLRFKVQLDHDDVPKAVKIFRANEKKSFQTLENCSLQLEGRLYARSERAPPFECRP
jgi:hypothetical protein